MFTGAFAINPVNDERIPIFVADYVLAGYGTGAIMAVPGQDQRDWDFAEEFDLPIVRTVQPPDGFDGQAFLGDGLAINSGFLNGLDVATAKTRIIEWLEANDRGEGAITYKLRDWLFSRQRYWGEPFPIVYDADGLPVALPESMLPVELPEMVDFEPKIVADDVETLPEPPLARAEQWVEVELDLGDGPQVYLRETNTMPQWAGSCWYYLRYLDPTNEDRLVDPEVERYWMLDSKPSGGVDLYVGGAEHAVLHLLYARFWHKVLFDLGHVSTPEPFGRLFNQGTITAAEFMDDRGVYVDAAERRRARRGLLLGRRRGAALVGPDGQEPQERGRARRDLRRLRRRHAPPLRDVHGAARRQPAVEHHRHRRRVPLPPAVLAQRGRRGHR